MTTAEFIIGHSSDDAAERRQEARKIFWAFLAAVFIHLVIGYVLAVSNGLFSAVPVAEEEKPIEMTFVDLATPAPVPKNSMFIETDESKKAPEPQEKTFESNANSIGASEVPATGEMPLPEQEGKERPFMNLETQHYSLATQGAQPHPSVPPAETPQPSQAPTATPAPDQLALLTRTPTPPPVDRATPVEQQPPKSSYRPQKQRTLIRGNISNRGISSVNALGTPLGRYQKYVENAIGSRWYASVAKQQDLVEIGTARLVFWVDRNGHVNNLKVVENSNNELFANLCIQAVQEAQLPPMSDDLAATLPPEGLEADFPFTIYVP